MTANKRVLQRLDKTVVDIVASASHCVMYELGGGKNSPSWEKKDVEGSLFIVKRSTACPYSLIVLNRNSPSNFTQDIDGKTQTKIMEKLLMFKTVDTETKADLVRGLYFHDESERDSVNATFERIINKLEVSSLLPLQQATPEVAEATPVTQSGTVDEIATATLLSQLGINPKSPGLNSTEATNQPPAINSPAALTNTAKPTNTYSPGMILDKKSLQLSLMSLIQDERFIDLIHAQYVKVTSARAGNKQM